MNTTRMIARAGGALAVMMMMAFASGCSSADQSATSDSEVQEGAPAAVTAAAESLKLGAAKGSDGAAGTIYYAFEKGTVGFSNVLQKVSTVRIQDASLDELSRNVEISGDLLNAAIYLGVGAFKHTEGAAGSSYYEFERATARITNEDQALRSVTFSDQNLGELTGEVLSAAVRLELGAFKSAEGAAGSAYYDFDRGFVQFSNVNQTLSGVTVKDAALSGESKEVALNAAVVKAAVDANLGRLRGADGGAGHAYYEFDLGTIDYSNVEQKVLGVIPKD